MSKLENDIEIKPELDNVLKYIRLIWESVGP